MSTPDDDRLDQLAARVRALGDAFDVPPPTSRPWEAEPSQRPHRTMPTWLTASMATAGVAVAVVGVAWLIGTFRGEPTGTGIPAPPATSSPTPGDVETGEPGPLSAVDPDNTCWEGPPFLDEPPFHPTMAAALGALASDLTKDQFADDPVLAVLAVGVHTMLDDLDGGTEPSLDQLGRLEVGADTDGNGTDDVMVWLLDHDHDSQGEQFTVDQFAVAVECSAPATPSISPLPADSPTGGDPPPAWLDGTWVHYDLGSAGPSYQFAWMEFQAGNRVEATWNCNPIAASWDVSDNGVRIHSSHRFDLGCSAPEVEFAAWEVLEGMFHDLPIVLGAGADRDVLTWIADEGSALDWRRLEQFSRDLSEHVTDGMTRAGHDATAFGAAGMEVSGTGEVGAETVDILVAPRLVESTAQIEPSSTIDASGITVTLGSIDHDRLAAEFDCGALRWRFAGSDSHAVETMATDVASDAVCPDTSAADTIPTASVTTRDSPPLSMAMGTYCFLPGPEPALAEGICADYPHRRSATTSRPSGSSEVSACTSTSDSNPPGSGWTSEAATTPSR